MSNTVAVREVINANIHRDIEQSIADPADVVTGLTADKDDLNFLDGSVAGTAVASKALVLGANKDVDVIAVADLKLGAGAGTSMTASAAELNVLDGQVLSVEAPAGITGGVGTVYADSVTKIGSIKKTEILIDLTGLSSSTTDLDVIGQGAAAAAHIGRITAALNGTVLGGKITCLEAPVGGVDDIDLYSATVGTAKFDDGIAALTETALHTHGGAWSIGQVGILTDIPPANDYLYLTGGAAGTAAPYTAGKFLVELYGY